MYIADLFTIAKMWRQPQCSTVVEWINSGISVQQGIFCKKYKGAMKPQKATEETNAYCLIKEANLKRPHAL